MRGRKPMYYPTFSIEEMEVVEQTLRRSNAPFGHVRRAQLAKLLAEEPTIANVEAARRLGVHEQFVHKWRQRWTEGEFCLEDLPRSGRPRDFSPSVDHDDQEHRLRIARPA
jgi:Winged helix-turn helix